ncbi:FAD-binding oxidoreductase [Desulfovibrio sp. OttesenSCG-928-G15]|nr:FAD-binding oxidoreductase [Desulfovibrio sp. OttesenSCG-928-G15]
MTHGCTSHSQDFLVIGGGIVGASIAYGIQRLGFKTALVDTAPGQTGADKASRGNMGLIWCQSKFAHFPKYARWGFTASSAYAPFVSDVEEFSGINTHYSPSGGLIPCLGEKDFSSREQYLGALRKSVGADYPARMILRDELQSKLPRVPFGPEVCGAVWCDRDGFIEPLQLLYAVRKAFVNLGGQWHSESPIFSVRQEGAGYKALGPGGSYSAAKIILAAGLSNKKLCSELGLTLPIFADRSQVMLTERIDDILPIPILGITRTPGGTVMIGFKHERAGSDSSIAPDIVIEEGKWALRVWPELGKLRIIRTWSGLRVMPEDGQPIYDTVPGHPKVFIVNAHSAVTLAPLHASILPQWITGDSALPEDALSFSLARFNPQAQEQAC